MLLNIDKPAKTATLHADSCVHVPDPLGSEPKPVGRLGRDGGWFQARSLSEAQAIAARELPSATFVRCSWC